MTVASGKLLPATSAPAHGERAEVVARLGGVIIQQVLSGSLDAPMDYDQDHDEWALVLAGRAVVDAGGAQHALFAGDWLLLPARVPHRLVETQPGTVWLTVHGARDGAPQ